MIALVLIVFPNIVGWWSIGESQWRTTRLSVLSPLHPPGSDGGARRRPDGVFRGGAGRLLPRGGACAEGDLRLSVPAGARRRVDRGPQPGPRRGELVDPQQGRQILGTWLSAWPGSVWPCIASPPWRSRAGTGPRIGGRRSSTSRSRDYALMAAIGLASFGVAVAGVARQRHGDAPAAIPGQWRRPDSRTGSSTCCGSRVPPRRRRGRRCGST